MGSGGSRLAGHSCHGLRTGRNAPSAARPTSHAPKHGGDDRSSRSGVDPTSGRNVLAMLLLVDENMHCVPRGGSRLRSAGRQGTCAPRPPPAPARGPSAAGPTLHCPFPTTTAMRWDPRPPRRTGPPGPAGPPSRRSLRHHQRSSRPDPPRPGLDHGRPAAAATRPGLRRTQRSNQWRQRHRPAAGHQRIRPPHVHPRSQ